MSVFIGVTGAANDVSVALSLAKIALVCLDKGMPCEFAFDQCDRMTSGYANAFVMTLLEKYPVDKVT
jgi:hypothetical protein